jgi:hypothetical protein
MIEFSFFAEGFDQGDDGALILSRRVGDSTTPSEEERGARAREIVTPG